MESEVSQSSSEKSSRSTLSIYSYDIFFENFPEKELVLQILNDERSWGPKVRETVRREMADWIVTVSSRASLHKLFPNQDTKLSLTAFEDQKAPITYFNKENWTKSPNPDFVTQTEYKTYLVNHEFGHVLHYGHRQDKSGYCYVMYQQTKQGKCWPCVWPRLCGDIDESFF